MDWYFCEPGDAPAKGCVERLQGYLETNFEPGRRFANQLDIQLQLDAWFEKANGRMHKTLHARPIDRLAEELEVMRALPAPEPDVDRRWVTRVPPDPHLRFDTCDYSLDPNLVGHRVEVRASQRENVAVALSAALATAVAEAAAQQEEQHDHDEEDGEHEPRTGLSGRLLGTTPTGRPVGRHAPPGWRPRALLAVNCERSPQSAPGGFPPG